MSEFAETPREELEKIQAKRLAAARAKQAEQEQEEQDKTAGSMEQLGELLATTLRQQAELDPTFGKELNDIAVQARVAAERLIDQKQLWKTASFGEKVKLAPGMARAALLMGACKTITQGIYAGATEQAITQAKADGLWTPEDVSQISGWMRELDSPLEIAPLMSMPDLPQVQPPTLSIPDLPQVQPPLPTP